MTVIPLPDRARPVRPADDDAVELPEAGDAAVAAVLLLVGAMPLLGELLHRSFGPTALGVSALMTAFAAWQLAAEAAASLRAGRRADR